MATSEIIIENTTPENAERAYIQLIPTRSEIDKIFIDNNAADKISDFGFVTNFSSPIQPGETLTLKVSYSGEPASIDYVNFQGFTRENKIATFNFTPSKPITVDSDEAFANHIKRLNFIETITDPVIKKAQEFFAYYDNQTLPELVNRNPDIPDSEKRKRIQIIMNTVGILTSRVLRRGMFGSQNTIPPQDALENIDKASAAYLSELQKNIFNKFYLIDNTLDLEGIEVAFELFANGDLRFPDPLGIRNGEPDSAFEFSFAEWALLAVENGIEQNFWRAIAPKLIKSQEIFMQVYKPNKPAPYRYEEYLPVNFAESKKVNAEFKRTLRQKYLHFSHEEAVLWMGKNSFNAFTANFANA